MRGWRCFLLRAGAVAALFCPAVVWTQSPAGQAAASGERVISGELVDAKSGRAIADAAVTLRKPEDRVFAAECTTDAEGRFYFAHLGDGRFALRAAHRGYIAAAYEEHDGAFTAIVTGEGLVSTGLRFPLDPQAVLYGTVAEDSGDPVPQASVALFRQDSRGGSRNIVRVGQTSADDLGNYEFPRLGPGNYYLSVTAKPWYAGSRPTFGNSSSEHRSSQLDVAYPITFYPDATEAGSAVPIAVAAGDRIPVNFTLHPVPSVHISMQFPIGEGTPGVIIPQLHQEVFGAAETIQPNVSINTSEPLPGGKLMSIIEISGLAPGQYDADLPGPDGQYNRATSIDASADRQNLELSSGGPLAEVSGKVAMASGETPPAGLTLALMPLQGENRDSARVDAKGSFTLGNVRPGSYELVITATGFPMAITRLNAKGATVSGDMVTVGTEPVTLWATAAETTAAVTGFVRSGGKPASGVFLLLVPAGKTAGRGAYRTNQSDSDGSFRFRHVLPGDYTLIAVEEGWTLDWADRDAIARYLPGGAGVTVPLHAGEIALKDAVAVQQK